MIKEEQQYQITKSRAEQFRKALAELEQAPDASHHPIQVKAHKDSVASQLAELEQQIAEYEKGFVWEEPPDDLPDDELLAWGFYQAQRKREYEARQRTLVCSPQALHDAREHVLAAAGALLDSTFEEQPNGEVFLNLNSSRNVQAVRQLRAAWFAYQAALKAVKGTDT